MSKITILIERQNFTLVHVKLDGKKVSVVGDVKMLVNVKEDGNGILQSKKIDETIDAFPHPDLTKALWDMKPFLLEEWNFLFPIETINEFKAAKELEKGLTKAEQKIITELSLFFEDKLQEKSEKVTITGAKVSGKVPGIQITGKNKPEDKQIAMNMPRRNFEKDDEGNGGELRELWDVLENEVFKLMYEGKQAQLSVVDSTDDDGDDKLPFNNKDADNQEQS